MPLYEYKCERCGDVFEVIQKFSDAPLTVHDNCGGAVARLLSAAALQFKGTGWYITDYARAPQSKRDGDAPPPKPESAKPAPKSDSTPAASASDK
ncbi:MAG: zinc ribbon domain-containing protein [Acidobacteria bacterium]|nr:zinc ribbon domain-containing protein [Acidobacteriota bacterium]